MQKELSRMLTTSQIQHPVKRGALLAAIGAMISGPIGLCVVALTQPQPLWSGVDAFVSNYHWVQIAPYYFGLMLAIGSTMLLLGLSFSDGVSHLAKLSALITLVLYLIMVVFNYMMQIAVVPQLARHFVEEYRSSISLLSMSNADSVCWVVEMWAYGFLSLAFIFVKGCFPSSARRVRVLLWTNLGMSLLAMLLSFGGTRWVLEPAGLASFLAWNLVFVWLLVEIYRNERRISVDSTAG